MDLRITRRNASAMLISAAALGLGRASAQEQPLLRIAHDTPIAWLPFYIAYERKLMQSAGVAPKVVPSPHGTATLIAVAGNAADTGVSTDMSVCVGALSKASAKIVASFNRVENMELACVTSIKTPADLKGKKIAVVQANPSQYYFAQLLKKHGLKPTDLTIVKLGPPEMLSALKGGAIDGFVWQEPFLTQAAKTEGAKFHRLAEPGLNSIYASVIVSDAALAQKRPELVKMLRALDEACAFIKANPEEAIRIGATYSQMDPAVVADAMTRMQIGLTLDVDSMKAKMIDQAKWAIAEGVARPDSVIPDYAGYMDPSLLADARKG